MVAEVQKQTRILGGERGTVESGGEERERGGIIHNGRSVGANSSLPLGFTRLSIQHVLWNTMP